MGFIFGFRIIYNIRLICCYGLDVEIDIGRRDFSIGDRLIWRKGSFIFLFLKREV